MKEYLLSIAALLIMVSVAAPPTCENITGQVCGNKIQLPPGMIAKLYKGLFRKPPAGVHAICMNDAFGRVCKYYIPQATCCPNPCMFGGTCIAKQNTFQCQCPPHRTGKTCEQVYNGNPCASYPCQAGGTCRFLYVGCGPFWCRPIYRCICPYGRTGTNCEIGYPQFGPVIPVMRSGGIQCDNDKCCLTDIQMWNYNTVRGKQVVQLPGSQQLIDVGKCRSEGATCPIDGSGKCDQYPRLTSVLVYTTDFPGIEFVSVSVPSYCRCV